MFPHSAFKQWQQGGLTEEKVNELRRIIGVDTDVWCRRICISQSILVTMTHISLCTHRYSLKLIMASHHRPLQLLEMDNELKVRAASRVPPISKSMLDCWTTVVNSLSLCCVILSLELQLALVKQRAWLKRATWRNATEMARAYA